jgi:hypothetical protein
MNNGVEGKPNIELVTKSRQFSLLAQITGQRQRGSKLM